MISAMIELSSKQRQKLCKLAQSMNADVIVGGGGVSDSLIAHVDLLMKTHELIKVKFNDFKDDKVELTNQIAAGTNSSLVRLIGNVAILYRPAEKAEDRKIKL